MSTPYEDFPTPELVQARKSLAALVERPDLTEDQRRAFDELLCWTVIELADRVTSLVEINDPPTFGKALEALALDTGIHSIQTIPYTRGVNEMNSKTVVMPSGARFRGGARDVR
jgi:hypothetical protein